MGHICTRGAGSNPEFRFLIGLTSTRDCDMSHWIELHRRLRFQCKISYEIGQESLSQSQTYCGGCDRGLLGGDSTERSPERQLALLNSFSLQKEKWRQLKATPKAGSRRATKKADLPFPLHVRRGNTKGVVVYCTQGTPESPTFPSSFDNFGLGRSGNLTVDDSCQSGRPPPAAIFVVAKDFQRGRSQAPANGKEASRVS